MKKKIDFAKFTEAELLLDIKYGKIMSVDRVPKSSKLLKLSVDFAEPSPRTVITNIGDRIGNAEALLNRTFPFVVNFEPMTIMGILSEAMILVPRRDDDSITLDIEPGHKLL